MKREPDSVDRALSCLSDRWTFLVLREAFFGVRRFEDIQRNLGIARNILADRLRLLVAQGIFERRQYQEHPERFEYRLTQKGRDIYPIVLELMRWGDRWMAEADGPPLVLYHTACGHQLTPLSVCAACGEVIDIHQVRYEQGPGAKKNSKEA